MVENRSKLAYQFKDKLCERLYYRARTKSQIWGFAWRESPKTLENHWDKHTKGMTEEEKLELLKACFLSADAQEKYRKEEMKHKALFRPKGIAPWFSSGGWGDGIDDEGTLKEDRVFKLCKCGKETHGPTFTECADCLGKDKNGRLKGWEAEKMREYYKKHPEIDYGKLKELTPAQSIRAIKSLLAGVR